MRNAMMLQALAVALTTTTGCGTLMGGATPSGAPAGQTETQGAVVTPKQEEMVRDGETRAYAQADKAVDEEIARMEKDALKALRVALGKESPMQGMPTTESSAKLARDLRKAKHKLKLEPVRDQDGKPVADQFLQLKDSGVDRIQVLSRKIGAGKASKAEIAEAQKLGQSMQSVGDLSTHVRGISMSAMMLNNRLHTETFTTMQRAAGVVRSRKQLGMKLNEQDYAIIRGGLAREKRIGALSASMIGMLAAYQRVLNEGKGDPKALDIIAETTLKAFPMKPEVTNDDAREYVEHLEENVARTRAQYEKGMRSLFGDKKYEAEMKPHMDAIFKQAADAKNTKSIQETLAERNAEAARRREARGARGASDVDGAVNLGRAAASGDVAGAAKAASGLVPGGNAIGSSISGISALTKGDPKGALKAATDLAPLVPGGSAIKEGLGLATKLLFG